MCRGLAVADHSHPQTAISPAVDIAVALACLVREMTGGAPPILGAVDSCLVTSSRATTN